MVPAEPAGGQPASASLLIAFGILLITGQLGETTARLARYTGWQIYLGHGASDTCAGRGRARGAVREDVPEHERPWIVIVWNDPINLMSYVTFVFQKLFGYSREKATKLMLQVHNEGKAVVSGGPREKAEHDVARLHAHGLWATMRQD